MMVRHGSIGSIIEALGGSKEPRPKFAIKIKSILHTRKS